MTKFSLFIGNICFLLLLFGFELHAQEVDIFLKKNQKIIASIPGKVTTVVVGISNLSSMDLRLQPQHDYPEAWNSISDSKPFVIKSGEKLTKLLSFIAPNLTPAGEYNLVFELFDLEAKATIQSFSFQVEIEELVNLSVKGIETPDFVVAGEDIQAKFMVRNFGNSEKEIKLTSHNCKLVGSATIKLKPNTVQIVEVVTTTHPNLHKVSRKSLRLEGCVLSNPKIKAHAYLHARIIPNANAEINDIRRLPGYARISYIGRSHADGNYISGWQAELVARGHLDKTGDNNLEVRLRGPNQFNISSLGLYDEYSARLNTPNYHIHVGDKTFSLSPLTEYARNGRGIEGSYRHKNIEIGGFYQKPRFFPEIESETGAYARHYFNSDNSLGLNYLNKSFRKSHSKATMLSLFGQFRPLKNTFIETEFSQGYVGMENGYAGHFKLESSPFKQLRFSSTVVYASRDFPGYFSNTWFYNAAVNYAVTPKISVFGNVYQDENNAARDTLFATAPLSKRYQAGLSFRLFKKTQIRGYLRQNELKDQLPSLKFHRENRSLKVQVSQELRLFRFSTALEYGLIENFLNPENERFSKLFRTYLDINYRLSHRNNFRGFIQFFENNRFDNLEHKQVVFGISGQSKLTKSTTLKFQYQNTFAIEEYYRDRNLFELHLTQRFKKQHEITLSSRYALLRQTTDMGDFSLAAHYKYNFGIPLEGRENLTSLYGQIFNSGTESVEGIVLHLNGRSVVSDENGNFKFKSLTPGKYYLLLDKTSLDLHQIPDVPTPIEVEIIEGEDTRISFGMTTSVTISGTMNIFQGGGLFISSNPKKMELPGPVLIELNNGIETFRQVTEADGSFVFSGLRPGKWNLTVIHNELFKNFLFEDEAFELELKPGKKENIQIRIRKKERKIKFLQTLSLSSKDDD